MYKLLFWEDSEVFVQGQLCMHAKKKRTKKQTNTEQTQFREEKKKGNGVRK